MKVDPSSHLSRLLQVDTGKGSKAPTGAAAEAPKSSPAAVTHLVSQGLQDSSHDIDGARITEIREAITEGKLAVDTGKIADKLLANVRDMLDGASS